MEVLRNWGIEFVCASCTERTSIGNTERFTSVCLLSVVLVSVYYWLCWMTVRVKELENMRLIWFWKRTVRWCAFSWSICDENCQISMCTESGNFVWLCRHIQLMRRQHQRRGTVGESQHWQKETLSLKMIVSKNRSTAAQVTAELDMYLSGRPRFHKNCPTSTVGLQLLKVWL
jgi:hypothetical protein